MSLGVSGGGASESSQSGPYKWVRRGGKDVANLFGNLLQQQGQNVFSDPTGNIGRIWQNLFGDNPTGDYLGARQRMESILSGSAAGDAFNQAYQFMLPQAQRSIELMKQNVLNAAAPQGLRFSSDVMNQQRQGAQDILLGTQGQAVNAGLGMADQQRQAAQDLFSMIAQLGEANLARQLPLLVQFLSSFPTQSTGRRSAGTQWTVGGGMQDLASLANANVGF